MSIRERITDPNNLVEKQGAKLLSMVRQERVKQQPVHPHQVKL